MLEATKQNSSEQVDDPETSARLTLLVTIQLIATFSGVCISDRSYAETSGFSELLRNAKCRKQIHEIFAEKFEIPLTEGNFDD